MSLSKRLLSILAIPLLAILFSIVIAKPTNAAEFHFKDYTLAQDQTVKDDLYICNSNAEINGLVQGDLLVISQNVKITGTVTGDVYIIGSNVTFSGNAYNNLFAIGNDITLQGIVKGNTYTMATTTNFSGNVEKDFASIAMTTNTTGTIGDDARIITSGGAIDSVIKGDLVIIGNQYALQQDKVSGNVYNAAKIKGIAQEQGVNFDTNTKTVPTYTQNWTDKLFFALFAFCSMSLVGYFMIAAAPIKTGKVIAKITNSPKDFIISFVLGLGILIVAPLALFFFSISLVGLPLALFLFGILLFLTIFGKLWVEVAFGQEILTLLKSEGYRPFKSLAIGRLITVAINLIPIVGTIYSIVIMSTAVGAFTRVKVDYWNMSKKK